MFGFNEIICETGLKPNSDTYIQLQHHQWRTLWSNMKSDYVSLWYTQFRKLRASKGSDLLLCNDTEFDLHLVIHCIEYIALTTAVPFNTGHPSAVSRSRQLKAALQVFSHYKVPLTFRYSWKRLRKRCSKNLIKFPQVYIAFVLQYIYCFEKNDKYWLNESWETWLPKTFQMHYRTISFSTNHYWYFLQQVCKNHQYINHFPFLPFMNTLKNGCVNTLKTKIKKYLMEYCCIFYTSFCVRLLIKALFHCCDYVKCILLCSFRWSAQTFFPLWGNGRNGNWSKSDKLVKILWWNFHTSPKWSVIICWKGKFLLYWIIFLDLSSKMPVTYNYGTDYNRVATHLEIRE